MKRKTRTFIGDFETTVFDGQTDTEVWASAVVELFSDDVKIFNSIDDTFDYLVSLDTSIIIYYHNLKFDGNFWLWFLKFKAGYKESYHVIDEEENIVEWNRNSEMKNHSFRYVISDMGMWYCIIIKVNGHIIEIRDSLKLLPFSVKAIGKAFNTEHQKLEMEYKGFRFAGCKISEEEKKYIRNDVLVVKEALEIMYKQGNDKMTIGACCMSKFKSKYKGDKEYYNTLFPDLSKIYIDEEIYGVPTAEKYVRKSYKGGWCYNVPEKTEVKCTDGCTADVNSLYPSMMHSESGNYFPLGKPNFWSGNFIPEQATKKNRYFFIRIRTAFEIKNGMLPTVQIKGDLRYRATEWLTTSDLISNNPKHKGKHIKYLENDEGILERQKVTITFTCTDYYLFREHYNVEDFEILDGCWFFTDIGIFDDYINYYREIKVNSKGAMRTLAKLFLNNLYGKFAMSDDSSFKIIRQEDNEVLSFINVEEHKKRVGYIPIGSAITSYARNFTIRAAQMNYNGSERGFIYADTDSIHCDLNPSEVKGIKIHPTDFCCWKLEATWDEAYFIRQKTYVEHIIEEDLEPIDNPYWNVKCAGMPDRCKDLFMHSVSGIDFTDEEKEKMTDDVKNFLYDDSGNLIKRSIEDFKIGLKIPGKLVPKNIKGGVLLTETEYTMRPKL